MAKWCPLLCERVTYMACNDCDDDTKALCRRKKDNSKQEKQNVTLADSKAELKAKNNSH